MNATLLLDRDARCLVRGDGRVFDPQRCAWGEDRSRDVARLEAIGAAGALRWLAHETAVAWRVPVGVIGPREVDATRYALAERVGAALAGVRLPVLCGGRGGVMEAVCRGATGAGGLAIGLLPEGDPALANPYAGVVLATGIGEARSIWPSRIRFEVSNISVENVV